MPSATGLQKGYGDRAINGLGHWAPTGRNSVVLVPVCFLHDIHCLSIFDLAVSAVSGRHCVLRLAAK